MSPTQPEHGCSKLRMVPSYPAIELHEASAVGIHQPDQRADAVETKGMARTVTREALAAFILLALDGSYDPLDWQHFMVAHYIDPEMETARRECVRLIAVQSNGNPNMLSGDEIQHLKAIVDTLA